jgi:RNA polymerase sigma-70 factor, ECF subfamily
VTTTTDQAGGDAVIEHVVQSHRRELLVHCYRMLGGLEDAEDALQETLLKAWRRLDTFEGRSSMRAWLYRIATNVCLDALDRRARRILPTTITGPADPNTAPAPDDLDTPWLQPIPDALLDRPDDTADPSTVVIAREHIELAFIAAIQHLPARQRAVLLLRDVLGYSGAETASLLGTSPAAANSALQRARAHLEAGLPQAALHRPTGDPAELVQRYMRAWQAGDVQALVALLRADAHMAMPPTPSWYQGRDNICTYLRQLFSTPWGRDLELVPTSANRQPALAVYAPGNTPFAVKVFTMDGTHISAITGFVSTDVLKSFGLVRARLRP